MIKISTGGVIALLVAAVAGLYYLDSLKVFSVADPENPINETAVDSYQAVTGSDEEPGADLYDVLHEDGSNPWSWYNPLYYVTEGFDTLAGVD